MNKATPGPCKEVVMGPTPHGGVYMVSYYFNSKYAPVPKAEATRVIVHEYDEKNRSVWRDYISCGPNDEEEYAALEACEQADTPQPMRSNKKPAFKVAARSRVERPLEPRAESRRRAPARAEAPAGRESAREEERPPRSRRSRGGQRSAAQKPHAAEGRAPRAAGEKPHRTAEKRPQAQPGAPRPQRSGSPKKPRPQGAASRPGGPVNAGSRPAEGPSPNGSPNPNRRRRRPRRPGGPTEGGRPPKPQD